ncbi:substrate-binding periplasmic protein [Stutzerimonas xanthomarina]|jgi:ABC-type amino acid transport substrate-binding protein|uniref:substrate-binding periplasmic protein n=1 Tax=Stutzerimonas xanthomarina TaxID=271420 RepID=UPI0029BB8496|nr:transporter substrate-binding domain-containing protein [Stutzerimonas xanthomarina]MDX2352880.1 transporter substrate-binding domain-containing protein [Stutzerimonas xanthomarina]
MRCAVSLKSALLAVLLATPVAAHAAAAKCDRLIATGGADNPPFLWRDPQNPKRLVGANADLLKKITDSLDLKLEVLYTGDAGAALEQVRSGRVDVLADAVLAPKELAYLDFIHPSITALQMSAWVGQEPGFLYSDRQDLAGRTGAYVKTGSYGSAFEHYAKENLRLRAAPSLAEALNRLSTGKADYVLHERYSFIAYAAGQGLLADIQRLEPAVFSRGLHFAVAHDSACNGPWLRGQLAIKMTELRAAGVPQQLLVENLERWKQQPAPTRNSQR